MNLYEILGVERSATKAEIRAAWKSKAQTLHPDKGGDKEAFNAAKHAYTTLFDDARRLHYDKHGTNPQTTDVEAAARSAIALVLLEAIDQAQNLNTQDIITAVRVHFLVQIKTVTEKMRECGDAIAKRNRALRRLRYKNKNKPNFMMQIIRHNIDEIKVLLSGLSERKALYTLCVTLIDDYEYEVDTKVPRFYYE